VDAEQLLPDDLLERIRGRAAGYDETNGFFSEDLTELAAAGYLKLFVPVSDGGSGLGLEAAVRCQRRLATAAPATALAVNMHLVWTGVARVLAERGDASLGFVLREAAAGEIFAFGNSEAGNDSVLFDSLTEAELVHGFMERGAAGYRILDDWNTLGMRASQSNTTVLDGAEVAADRIFRKLPVGPNADPLIFAIFACFETLLAGVYAGIGERALLLGVEAAKRRTSLKYGGRSLAQDPDIRWKVAEAAMAMEALYPQLAEVARDVDQLVDHGSLWFPKLVGLKVRATETARTVVDLAIRVSGGSSYFRGSELGRLYRDVLAGMFHPSDDESAHNTVANAWLGPLED